MGDTQVLPLCSTALTKLGYVGHTHCSESCDLQDLMVNLRHTTIFQGNGWTNKHFHDNFVTQQKSREKKVSSIVLNTAIKVNEAQRRISIHQGIEWNSSILL